VPRLRGMVAAQAVLPGFGLPPGPDERVQGVPKRASKRRSKPAKSPPRGVNPLATMGLLRRYTFQGSSRKGVHVIRHMFPYFRDGVDDLEAMIRVWMADEPADLYG
jgi:hypothetical protein